MGLRDVKRTEIVPVILNLRSRRHGETEVREYFGEFVHHLTDWMHRSLRLDRRRQSHIQLLGSQARIECRRLERFLLARDGGGDAFAQVVYFWTFDQPFLGRHAAQRLEKCRNLLLVAQPLDRKGKRLKSSHTYV